MVGPPIVFGFYLAGARSNPQIGLAVAIVGSLIYYPVAILADVRETTSQQALNSSTPLKPSPIPSISPIPNVKLGVDQNVWELVDAETIDITGTTEPNASVSATWDGGSTATSADAAGVFRLNLGPFTEEVTVSVTIKAVAQGKREQTSTVAIHVTISEGKFKALAEQILYDQLNKDPDALAGKIVTYKGEVFQYDSRTTTSNMIVSVTDEGYGFWTDNVFISLDPAIASEMDENDIIQFWGRVRGSYSYTTAIGGTNTIPHIEVRYMTLTKKQ